MSYFSDYGEQDLLFIIYFSHLSLLHPVHYLLHLLLSFSVSIFMHLVSSLEESEEALGVSFFCFDFYLGWEVFISFLDLNLHGVGDLLLLLVDLLDYVSQLRDIIVQSWAINGMLLLIL